jgi:hypothetical protein
MAGDGSSAAQDATPAKDSDRGLRPAWARLSPIQKAIGTIAGLIIGLAAVIQAIPVITGVFGGPSFAGDLSDPAKATEFVRFSHDHDGETVKVDITCPWDVTAPCHVENWGTKTALLIWVFEGEPCFEDSNDAPRMDECEGGNVYFVPLDTSGTETLITAAPGNFDMNFRGYFRINEDAFGAVYPRNIKTFDLRARPEPASK